MIHNTSYSNHMYSSSLTSSNSSTSIKIKNNLKQLFILFRNKKITMSSRTSSLSSSSTKTTSSTLAVSSSTSLSTLKNDFDHYHHHSNDKELLSSSILKNKSRYRKISRYNNDHNIILEEENHDKEEEEEKCIKRETIPHVTVPPFSPTYCKPNEFPYSNYYIKLPNGKYIIRYRDGNRNILGSDEIEGYLI